MWHVELTKLGTQLRVRVAVAACALGPVLFAVALVAQSSVPADTLFGRWVHESGFAMSLVVLGFCGQWVLPILVGIVAGDVAASEDRYRTWTLLLTRSRRRGEVLAGKALAVATYSMVVVVVLALSSTITGAVAVGTQPLVGLSGGLLAPNEAFQAVLASWATVLAPTLAIAAIAVLVSVVSRNSWVGVIAPVVVVAVLNLVARLSVVDPVRPLMPTTAFDAWHGLVRQGTYSGPVVDGLVVSAAWVVGSMAVAALALRSRDVVDA